MYITVCYFKLEPRLLCYMFVSSELRTLRQPATTAWVVHHATAAAHVSLNHPAQALSHFRASLQLRPAEVTSPEDRQVYEVGEEEEVQADCVCIVYLCVPVCVIEGGGANNHPCLKSPPPPPPPPLAFQNFDSEKG